LKLNAPQKVKLSPVFLHVRKRKWKDDRTGKIISNSWETAAKGTRYTKDFASFLKEVFGQLPHQ